MSSAVSKNANHIRGGRILAASRAVPAYRDVGDDDFHERVKYLLIDLRHYCDLHGLSFSRLDRAAQALYRQEVSDGAEDDISC